MHNSSLTSLLCAGGSLRRRALSSMAGTMILAACAQLVPAAGGQAHFSGAPVTLVSGFGILDIAVDDADNIYMVADGTVYKQTLTATGYVQTTIGSGLGNPDGVAVDAKGNVYITDIATSRILKETPYQNSYIQSLVDSTPFVSTASLAVDAEGDVYVGLGGDGIAEIYKETPSASGYKRSLVLSGIPDPENLTVDTKGNVYVTDNSTRRIIKATPNGIGYSASTILSGFTNAGGMAVDRNGVLYISDYVNNRVLRETPSGNSYIPSILVGPIFQQPVDVALDGNGNAFVVDSDDFNSVLEIATTGANFGAMPINANYTDVITYYFTFDEATTLTSDPIDHFTAGGFSMDFVTYGTNNGTCTGGAHFNAGESCYVNVFFQPQTAGSRHGAVVLINSQGQAIATGYASGVGMGSQVSYLPAVQKSVPYSNPGNDLPWGLAVDGYGDVFISDYANNAVKKELLVNSRFIEQRIGSGLNSPAGLAVDGAGNVYIADSGNNRVVKESPSGWGYAQSIVASGLGAPMFVAVDGGGVVYVADTGNHRILAETPSAGGYVQSVVPSIGLGADFGIAVDGSGGIYLADTAFGRVVKETPTTGGYTQETLFSGLTEPYGLAIDPVGDVYISQ
ncbi:MAG: NHL repeat-containing protein [Terracidiphilus sp.]